MADIYVKVGTDEKQRAILELLSTQGVEIALLPESDPEIHALFLDQRRNDKMDNLGQLRHLYKLEGHVRELVRIQTNVLSNEAERDFARRVKFSRYLEMQEAEFRLESLTGAARDRVLRSFESYEDVDKYIEYVLWRNKETP